MKTTIILALAAVLVLGLALGAGAADLGKAILWDGNNWTQVSQDAKLGYIFGVGNLADFEVAAAGQNPAFARAFVNDLRKMSVMQIVEQVDKFYQANPDKMGATVIEVVLRRCTTVCPPRPNEPAGGSGIGGRLGPGWLFRHVLYGAAGVERRRHRRGQRRPHRLGRGLSWLRRGHRRRGRHGGRLCL